MTYAVIETSNDGGKPIYLYDFVLGAAHFRYSSSDQDLILNGYKWATAQITDDGVKQSGDATTDTLTITCASTIGPVSLFQGTPPSQPIMVNIYAYHDGDTDSVLCYAGQVMQIGYPQPGQATFSCDAIAISMLRDGLRLGWQRNCPYALYDKGTCNADETAHAIPMMVLETTGNTATVSGLDAVADGTLNGGYMQWSHPVRGLEYRGIETQVGATITMFGLSDGLYYGLTVTGYPGCARTVSDCTTKFNNLDNYGGIPDMPGISPFNGDQVF